MAKSKTHDAGSRPTEQPEQPARSEGQALDIQLAELSNEISRIETEIERTAAIAKTTPGRIAQAKADYDAAFLRSDTAGMTAAQDRIRAANEERAAAVSKLGDFTKPLEELRDRSTTLRLKILDAVKATGDELEQARRAAQEARMHLDAVGHAAGKLTGIVASLQPYLPVVTSEQPPSEPAAPEPPGKPNCPRCGRADDVVEISPGHFCCQRTYHERLIFNADGKELPAGFALRAG